MNKLKSISLFVKDIFLQIILSFVAIVSWVEASDLGKMSYQGNGTYLKKINGEYEIIGTSVAMNSGFIGGSLSMGIICSVCIIMIVWIEINKKH